MTENIFNILTGTYRNIFIAESIKYWDKDNPLYKSRLDLVLTYDLSLLKHIESIGGTAFYIDHLIDNARMQKNNFLIYKFFQHWHDDENGEDLFKYKDIPFGFSFRLEIWNDFVFYIRIYLCLSLLKNIKMDKLYLTSKNDVIISVLDALQLFYTPDFHESNKRAEYFFPITQWMDEKIRPKGFRALLYKVRDILTVSYGYVMPFIDRWSWQQKKSTIFIQEYHPTRQILAHLRKDSQLRILLTNFSRGSKVSDNLSERLLPIPGSLKKYEKKAELLMSNFQNRKTNKLVLDDGTDITENIYEIIEKRINVRLTNTLRTLDGCISYIDKYPVDLEILIANIGHAATLFDCVCKNRNIPSYLIINGLLGPAYSDESKYASVINSYSISIKEFYFKGMDNIVTLGDPRMDMYPPSLIRSNINRQAPTITIGASGFNSVDLNSYVAVEFDFMFDVLSALSEIKATAKEVEIIIKVRGNGYRKQYEGFIAEFFPGLVKEVIDTLPIKEVLLKTDFYISIYSQTLFEASCLGIPCLYYKKDNEIMDPPFNNDSELVTVTSVNQLIQAFYDFQIQHERFSPFLQREVMEKYIGKLDGQNLERNIAFVYELLDEYK